MTPVLSYLLKANATLIVLYGLFVVCFRRDTFYGYIRWYLLVAIASAVVFPIIDISIWMAGSPAAVEVAQYVPGIEDVYYYVFAQSHIRTQQTGYAAEPVVARAITFGVIFLWCWLPVVLFMAGKRLFQMICIVRLWYGHPRKRHRNSAIISVDRNIQPFSFFGCIFLNPSVYSADELHEILTHEQVHCRQKHTIDILCVELLVCLCWFNPLVWLLRRDLKQNLEYYTDRMTLRQGFDRKHYQYSMLRVSGNAFQIANHFYFNHFKNLKNRIIMLNKKESPRILAAKYLLVVPALAATFLAVQASGLQVNEPDDVKVAHIHPVLADVEITPDLSVHTPYSENGKQIEIVESNPVPVPKAAVEGNNIPVSDDNEVLVSGTVINVIDGKKMPGVAITAKGMSVGVVTDMNGNYSITVPASTILQFSFPGGLVATREVALGNRQIIDVVMSPETQAREEEKVEKTSPTIRVRGVGQTGNQPLYIVDGKEFDQALNTISPDRIESITVLKEQSAIAMYGEKGKDGVIIIITKK